MRAAAIAAVATSGPACCCTVRSDRDRVAQAFVAAAIRLGPALPSRHGPLSQPHGRRCDSGITSCIGDLPRSARP